MSNEKQKWAESHRMNLQNIKYAAEEAKSDLQNIKSSVERIGILTSGGPYNEQYVLDSMDRIIHLCGKIQKKIVKWEKQIQNMKDSMPQD